MLIHDIIKTMYVTQGYLPDFPYHLISDEEMFDAFIYNESNFFATNYPCPADMDQKYNELVSAIKYHIDRYKQNQVSSTSDSSYSVPDWVYTYMVGSAVGPLSPENDRHDLFVLLDMDNNEDEFTDQIYNQIYTISLKWTYKIPSDKRLHRPPTMFGEPHVIKSLRLSQL